MSQELSSESTMSGDSTSAKAVPERRVGLWTPIILTVLCAATQVLPMWISSSPAPPLVMVMFMGPIVSLLLFLIWWLGFSKASWKEKLFGFGGVIAAFVLAAVFSHPSMGMAIMMYMPLLLLVGWTFALVVFRGNPAMRRIAIPICLLPAAVFCMSVRFKGVTGGFSAEFSPRWAKTAEDEYIASRSSLKPSKSVELSSGDVKPLVLAAGDWPAFRGPQRDGILRGAKIRTDWNQNPPKLLWRQRIGPGWSSITVVGNHGFTQEQRDKEEAVVCFNIDDGSEVWSHVDKTRFEEPVAGPGPRATPTFADGRLFTLGANGVLNAFDAASGKRLWSHDLVKKFEAALKDELDPKEKKNSVPMWGFAASPLVFGDKVAVYVGAKDKGVAVFNVADGKEVWAGGIGGHSYASTHFANIAGSDALLSTSNHGLQALDPATGRELWNHAWEVGDIVRCVQPGLLSDGRVAVGTAFGMGTQVINVSKSGEKFAAKELGTFTAFKPYFSDYVVIDDLAYGFDGAVFGCYDLKSGKRVWKGGRYGSGQAVLLKDQNLLLIVTETDGNVVLVPADKSGHKEVAKFKALSGKTWNHPTVAHGKLLVRNGEEIACFDVSEK